jgi:hypothetical protein
MAADDPLRRALLAALGPRPTAARRRELAALLQQLAEEQEQIAAADTRSGHIVRQAQIAQEASRQKTGRPKGSGARFVRVEPRETGHGAYVHVGRALWQELGEPARLDMQRIGRSVRLTPCGEAEGYRFTRPPNGMPKCTIGQDALDALRLDERRYDARIEAGAIVFEAG